MSLYTQAKMITACINEYNNVYTKAEQPVNGQGGLTLATWHLEF